MASGGPCGSVPLELELAVNIPSGSHAITAGTTASVLGFADMYDHEFYFSPPKDEIAEPPKKKQRRGAMVNILAKNAYFFPPPTSSDPYFFPIFAPPRDINTSLICSKSARSAKILPF